jgi:alcohol dehydrogenase class IV
MRYRASSTTSKQASIAAALGVDTREMPLEQAAARAAEAVADLIADLGLPHHLAAYDLSDADLEAAARPVATDDLPLRDLVGIYRAAL